MKNELIFGLILLHMVTDSTGQIVERISVKAGEDLSKFIQANGSYRFAEFSKGTVIFRNKQKITAPLNYNVLSGSMNFIGDKGDTLFIGNSDSISSVTIGKVLYYYYRGYIEVIGENEALKLAKKQKYMLETEKVGAYGVEAPAASITDYQNFYTATGSLGLTLNQNTVLQKEISYFWIDSKNRILPANEKNTMKLLAQDKHANFRDFLNQKRINFRKEEDLLQLLDYLKVLNSERQLILR